MLNDIMEQPQILAEIEGKNEAALRGLTAALKERGVRHALLAGRATSNHACVFGQYALGVYQGAVAALGAPSCVTLYNGRLDLSGALVIGVSQSGKAADAFALIERGRECGAVTAALTNEETSPMAKASEFQLYCSSGQETSVAATKSFTAQLYLLGLLAAYWGGDGDLLRALRALPGESERFLLEARGAAEECAPRFKDMSGGFILARGLCYGAALEAALKMQETCYISMKCYPNPEFYHGPIAQIDESSRVIVFASSGAAFEDNKAMILRLKQAGAQPFVVTDDAGLAKSTGGVLLPKPQNEVSGVFIYTFFAQCFAQALSLSLGLDPDKPRLLNKVTVTR